MKILNYGSLNIDLIYHVDHIVRPGETLPGGEVIQSAGGKGANQSVALSKAGAQVYHAGKIGEDGTWLLEKLKTYGVNTDYVRIGEGATGHAVIQVTSAGENSIILSGGGNRKIQEHEIDETLANFGNGDYLVLQNEINGTEKILTKAHERGMIICINPAPFERSVLSWPLALVNMLIVNEHEAAGLAEAEGSFEEVLNKLTAKFPAMEIIMTVGSQGSYYACGEERIHVPVRKVSVVDTTAAGDTYLGYFLASRIAGMPVTDSMKRASRASDMTVSRSGAMDSIPFAAEIDD